jgi:hypothetical protein
MRRSGRLLIQDFRCRFYYNRRTKQVRDNRAGLLHGERIFYSFYELSGEVSGQDETTASWQWQRVMCLLQGFYLFKMRKKFNIGLAIGGDFLLDKNRHDWLYHQKT